MQALPGDRFGKYEILSTLGAGGMGEVYRARDTKLGREVAIKVLPQPFASDPDRLARFEREAQVLAALNHPNIAHIYGLEGPTFAPDGATAGKQEGIGPFLVMELVGGPTLADRIAEGPLPVSEALAIAKQLADALEAAHEQGIVHRDLKPANIKVKEDGTVKVLDFGLAKLADPAGTGLQTGPHLTHSPTITSPAMTQAGMILGTAAYMSPEQAKGRAVDKRTDVWAFGCVLYEMLTAKRAFEGEDVTETIAAIVRGEPDWHALPNDLPAPIQLLIKRCLEKDRTKRVGDMSVARFLFVEPMGTGGTAPAMPSPVVIQPPPLWRRAIPLTVALAAGAVVSGIAAWMLRPVPVRAPVTRFTITLPQDQQFTSMGRQVLAISPDGTEIVYAVNGRLYLRRIGDTEARPIAGTDSSQNATSPVFSPDGNAIAFYSTTDRTIKRIAVSGGVPLTICEATPPAGISWTPDGLLFGQGVGGIVRVGLEGGKSETLVRVSNNELAHGPTILPGGEWLLFTLATGAGRVERWDKAQIVIQSLKTGERKIVIDGGSDARYVATGHLVYALGGTLFAVPFDVSALRVTGGPTPIIEGVRRASAVTAGSAQVDWSNTGSLVYIPGPSSTSLRQADLAFFDRKGVAELLKLPPGPYAYPRVSPDGKHVAFEIDGNIGIYDLIGARAIRRITFGGENRFPIWSSNGERVAFQSDRDGDAAIWWQRADGTGTAERLTRPDTGTSHVPESWSPKNDVFLFSVTKGSEMSLWVFSLNERKATSFNNVTSTTAFFTQSAFSPDGRWVAYVSNTEGGILVQPFPATGAKYQISRGGGLPAWSRDGNELFYVPGGGQFVVVRVTTQPTFGVGNPIPVIRPFVLPGPASPQAYDVGNDGRFIASASSAGAQSVNDSATIQVVLNWTEELKQRVPTR